MKLSPAQVALLKELVEKGPHYVAEYYTPATKLVALGLAEWWTGGSRTKLAITAEGERAYEISRPR